MLGVGVLNWVDWVGAVLILADGAALEPKDDFQTKDKKDEDCGQLLPDSFREAEFGMLKADLAPSAGLADLAGQNGACSYVEATRQEARAVQAV